MDKDLERSMSKSVLREVLVGSNPIADIDTVNNVNKLLAHLSVSLEEHHGVARLLYLPINLYMPVRDPSFRDLKESLETFLCSCGFVFYTDPKIENGSYRWRPVVRTRSVRASATREAALLAAALVDELQKRNERLGVSLALTQTPEMATARKATAEAWTASCEAAGAIATTILKLSVGASLLIGTYQVKVHPQDVAGVKAVNGTPVTWSEAISVWGKGGLFDPSLVEPKVPPGELNESPTN